MEPPLPPLRTSPGRLPFWLRVLQRVFTTLPTTARVRVYEYFFRQKWRNRARGVVRLPFGLALKVSDVLPLLGNEIAALSFVGQLRGVNVPVLFDSIPATPSDRGFMVSTWIDGDLPVDVWEQITAEDTERVVCDLREQLEALREQTEHPEHLICSSRGGPVLDFRVPWIDQENPRTFADPREFAAEMWPGLDHDEVPQRVALRPVLRPVIDRMDIPISFCHGDLQPKNMIFERGFHQWRAGKSRVALIDWEHGGWMPIYWDAVKATWLESTVDSEYTMMMRRIFPDSRIRETLDADWQWRLRANYLIM